jgi:hypothetical protein
MQSFDQGPGMSNEELYREAVRRVQKKTNFFRTLASYLVICAMLWVIALLTGGGLWPAWVMLGWGFALVWMAIDAFGLPGQTPGDRQRMIEEEMRRMQGPRR